MTLLQKVARCTVLYDERGLLTVQNHGVDAVIKVLYLAVNRYFDTYSIYSTVQITVKTHDDITS
jgi:hypothetical protein